MRNRFKGLDLIDTRVPYGLLMEVHSIVKETGIKTIPREKKKRAKTQNGLLRRP